MTYSWFAPVTVCIIVIINTIFFLIDQKKNDKPMIGLDLMVYACLTIMAASFYYLRSLSYSPVYNTNSIWNYCFDFIKGIFLLSAVALVPYGLYRFTGKWGRIGLQVIITVLMYFLFIYSRRIDFWSGVLIFNLSGAVVIYWVYCYRSKKKSNALPIFLVSIFIYIKNTIGSAYDYEDQIYLLLIIAVVVTYWTYCGIIAKKKSARHIVTGTILIIATIFSPIRVYSLCYSTERMTQIFYGNIDDFEEIAAYFKNPEYERDQDAIIYYDIRPSKVFCYSEGIEKYQVTDELADMLINLRKTGYYYELWVYRNGDICLFAKGKFILEFTSYEDIMAIMDKYDFIYYTKITDTEGWYIKADTRDSRWSPSIEDKAKLDQR